MLEIVFVVEGRIDIAGYKARLMPIGVAEDYIIDARDDDNVKLGWVYNTEEFERKCGRTYGHPVEFTLPGDFMERNQFDKLNIADEIDVMYDVISVEINKDGELEYYYYIEADKD